MNMFGKFVYGLGGFAIPLICVYGILGIILNMPIALILMNKHNSSKLYKVFTISLWVNAVISCWFTYWWTTFPHPDFTTLIREGGDYTIISLIASGFYFALGSVIIPKIIKEIKSYHNYKIGLDYDQTDIEQTEASSSTFLLFSSLIVYVFVFYLQTFQP